MWGVEVYRVRTLFLQCVSLCYAVAFHSLYTQVPGLYGDSGILPVRASLDPGSRVGKEPLLSLLLEAPTILWLVPYTGLGLTQAMELICIGGSLLGLACSLVPSLISTLPMVVLYILYLSLFTVGQTFLHFQWDTLLLEVGVLAALAAPLLPSYHKSPLARDHMSLALVRWLLFRMMFASGAVKLTSGCPAWWGLTAMPTHYSSQCLPTYLAWFANLQPQWLHSLAVVVTYVIEMPLTFLFFAPTAALRKFTAFNQVVLMVMIMLSGNYNFFNFLYLALCLSLADDSWFIPPVHDTKPGPTHPVTSCFCCLFHLSVFGILGWSLVQAFNLKFTSDFTISSSVAFTPADFDWFLSQAVPLGLGLGLLSLIWASIISLRRSFDARDTCWRNLASLMTTLLYLVMAAGMFCLSLPSYSGQLDRATYDSLPRVFKQADRSLGSLQMVHSYGLFRSMTGVGGRPELVFEGAMDEGGPWIEYHFRYKPGNISSAPTFMLPHQPRLDWQMWFAALGSYQHNPWLVSLAYRLLQGSPPVLALLDPNSPWQKKPPTYLRVRSYTYHFTGWGDKDWWVREGGEEYLPTLYRDHPSLQEFMKGQGGLGLTKEKKGPLSRMVQPWLHWLRNLSDLTPHHIQIWSYAWLALPLLKPFFIC